jgi:Carbohydrate binding domain
MNPPCLLTISQTIRAISHRSLFTSLLVLCVDGCSVQDFSYLSKGTAGGDNSAGGDSNQAVGGSGGSNGGDANQAGGGSDAGGKSGSKSNGGSGTTTTTSTATGGTVNQVGPTTVPTIGTGGSTVVANKCAYVASANGVMVTPPSQNFESITGAWTSQSGQAPPARIIDGDACEGTAYIRIDGAARKASWDGPSISVLPYVVPGHTYRVSIAARLSPTNTTTTSQQLTLNLAKKCVDTTVTDTYDWASVQSVTVASSWVRMTGVLTPTMTGCTTMSRYDVYIDGGEGDSATTFRSIDVDDFRLIDTTPGVGGSSG